jgi:hypothetical protein
MTREINESDWKLLRQFQPLALERFCQRVLAEVEQLTARYTLLRCRRKIQTLSEPRKALAA